MTDAPRGIAVIDIGATHWKAVLFDAGLTVRATRRMETGRRPGPPYPHLDAGALLRFAARSLAEFDAELPVDAVATCAHGSGLALLDEGGGLALPVMDYAAEPPDAIARAYQRVAPPFAEVLAPTNPAGLTLGRQLLWQETAFPGHFARVRRIVPWGQLLPFLLCGEAASEISALGAQTHLRDIAGGGWSSLARARGWDRLFAPIRPAWEALGGVSPEVARLRGRGAVLTGAHDSNADWLRWRAALPGELTLLSTGTWIIGFSSAADPAALDPARDTCAGIDVFARPVACSRFMGGREFAAVAQGAPAEAGSESAVASLIARGTIALPSFTDSGGPMPGTGGRGRVIGPPPDGAEERASLAALYCALMTAELLDALGIRCDGNGRIALAGPFAASPLYAGLLAALLPGREVLAAEAGDGGAAEGAALLALMDGPAPPPREARARAVAPARMPGLDAHRARWREAAASP